MSWECLGIPSEELEVSWKKEVESYLVQLLHLQPRPRQQGMWQVMDGQVGYADDGLISVD